MSRHPRAMENLITHKKLWDLSRRQKREISEMQGVLEKWHFRTFPTFVTRSSGCPDTEYV